MLLGLGHGVLGRGRGRGYPRERRDTRGEERGEGTGVRGKPDTTPVARGADPEASAGNTVPPAGSPRTSTRVGAPGRRMAHPGARSHGRAAPSPDSTADHLFSPDVPENRRTTERGQARVLPPHTRAKGEPLPFPVGLEQTRYLLNPTPRRKVRPDGDAPTVGPLESGDERGPVPRTIYL